MCVSCPSLSQEVNFFMTRHLFLLYEDLTNIFVYLYLKIRHKFGESVTKLRCFSPVVLEWRKCALHIILVKYILFQFQWKIIIICDSRNLRLRCVWNFEGESVTPLVSPSHVTLRCVNFKQSIKERFTNCERDRLCAL